MTIDTACSSALVAAHSSSLAVRFGECARALASGVSLKLAPLPTAAAAAAGMLATDGRCKTLDARANGYARAEGIGTLVLQHIDSDCALLLSGSAVRHDGRPRQTEVCCTTPHAQEIHATRKILAPKKQIPAPF